MSNHFWGLILNKYFITALGVADLCKLIDKLGFFKENEF